MDLFYTKNSEYEILSKNESKHCVNALRKKIKDKILVTEGKGIIYQAKITSINRGIVSFKKLNEQFSVKRNTRLEIAISLTKNKSRFEWFLEKSTEIGVDYIYPIICKRSERKQINIERCNKILISSLKQSKNAILPKISRIITFDHFLEKNLSNTYIAHCSSVTKKDFFECIKTQQNQSKIIVMIGPEGDFTKTEILKAQEKGVQSVSLGQNRLRTETAGIYVANCVQILF
ncbi:MAG: 16S rRNA (uracil(1498)-N(3))-methyltransferase [Flavobacteriales bacterium]|nr:16S rRNA (uracil(1498)-N(3))-methyltransferase [Flavobacteriales bacterium]|tara:strand:+ start:22233 stop:22928 length:696 start_codon:yes stop_codon:yes gene_type:complete